MDSVYTIVKKGRKIINCILVRVVIKHVFGVCLLKILNRKNKFKKKANASSYCSVRE